MKKMAWLVFAHHWESLSTEDWGLVVVKWFGRR